MSKEKTIEILKKLRSFHNGSYGAAIDEAITALMIVEDFERARIITGGRLNGRTHAYKCGLADGQRLARGEKLFNILPLEQQPGGDCISRAAVLAKKQLVELEDGQSFYCISPDDVKTLPSVTPQPYKEGSKKE